MQHGQEDRPLDVEFEPAIGQESLDDSLATGLLPEPLEDQGGSDPLGADDGQAALCVGGEDHDRVGQASPRDQEGIELAAVAEGKIA